MRCWLVNSGDRERPGIANGWWSSESMAEAPPASPPMHRIAVTIPRLPAIPLKHGPRAPNPVGSGITGVSRCAGGGRQQGQQGRV